MQNVHELAKQVSYLSATEKRELVRLVPELLQTDEEFMLKRWHSAQEDLRCDRVIEATTAVKKAKARRRATR